MQVGIRGSGYVVGANIAEVVDSFSFGPKIFAKELEDSDIAEGETRFGLVDMVFGGQHQIVREKQI